MALEEGRYVCGKTYEVCRDLMGDLIVRQLGVAEPAFTIECSDRHKFSALSMPEVLGIYRSGLRNGERIGADNVRRCVRAAIGG